MDRGRVRIEGPPHIRDERQDLVVHDDPAERVLRDVFVLGGDSRNLVAHETRLNVQDRHVGRDSATRNVERSENGVNAVHPLCDGGVHRNYPGARVRAAEYLPCKHTRQPYVGCVLRLACQLGGQVSARYGFSDVGCHGYLTTDRTDSRIRPYALQRHIFPASACRISSSVGLGLDSSSATALITKPGVQKPHCPPSFSRKARWMGLSESDDPSDSTVVTLLPSHIAARVMHELI